MTTASLRIDLDAILSNWRALDALSGTATQTAAVVKADCYGLGASRIARMLARNGVRTFFVACAEEGATLRQIVGEAPEIFILSGHCAGDTEMIGDLSLTPVLNSAEQMHRHFEALPGAAFGIQLDTGMNRLGFEASDWFAAAPAVLAAGPKLIMSHLACSDEADHPMNRQQLTEFKRMTEGMKVPRSLSATGGTLLGSEYHFDLVRPGIGLYAGRPFEAGTPAVTLSLPVIQTREVHPGETVGYSNAWTADKETRVATVAAGYADGLSRRLGNVATLWAGDIPCPVIGKVSMDLITVDITHLDEVPDALDLIGPNQRVDAIGDLIGTIGYEILTSLGHRYQRSYVGGAA
ncbi:alanine racemase [Paenirhodobacter enshiensis]|uniref:alanine racemase n=1 Tax=Paenirhodobacter enshiensis TaxID=1105367 RepID=UPI003FA25DB5